MRRYAIVLAAWLPFFAIWTLFALLYANYPWRAALATSLISMGTASLLGIGVWHLCRRRPWPLRLDLKFYLLQIFFASVYSILWSVIAYSLEVLRRGGGTWDIWRYQFLGWQLLMGVWLYGLFAGVSYAVQTRSRLHEKNACRAR